MLSFAWVLYIKLKVAVSSLEGLGGLRGDLRGDLRGGPALAESFSIGVAPPKP